MIVGGHSLCLDHYLKFQQASQIQDAIDANYLNFLLDEADFITGLPRTGPRYRVAQPIIHQGTMNFQNIKIEKSNIGAFNAGEIRKLDVMMNVINQKGNSELVKAIKEFTEAVIASTDADRRLKNELIEQISFLSTQAALPKEKRHPSVVSSVLKGIKDALTSSAALAMLMNSWDKLAPLFNQVFSG